MNEKFAHSPFECVFMVLSHSLDLYSLSLVMWLCYVIAVESLSNVVGSKDFAHISRKIAKA